MRRADLTPELIEICEDEFGAHFWKELPLGQVIGIVTLIDCIEIKPDCALPPGITVQDLACGDFSPGRFMWKRTDNPCRIGPWPYRGMQGLFEIADLDRVANRELGITAFKSNSGQTA